MEFEWHDLAFHREIGAVIDSIDRADFWVKLTRALGRFVTFNSWIALRFGKNEHPVVCAESPTPDGKPDALLQDYLAALYQLDPFYEVALNCRSSGLVTLADVAPDNFVSTEYYERYFRKNIVGDEVHFNYAIDTQHVLGFSVGAERRYSDRDAALFTLISPWVIALIRQRVPHELFDAGHTHADTPCRTEPQGDAYDYSIRFQQAAQQRGCVPLTAREVEVAILFLRGFSARAIAAKLTISFETVRAHRRHVYSKLGVNAQSELFSRFYAARHDNEYIEAPGSAASEFPR